ncbi:HOMEOBOX-LEUCINE ZIPPER PROTEIN MERISTEM L1 [Salix koriyanagi]|uniref:HOMEOBOX-LEUCINE ZIPPER PROTEIN MERISTEM L1 n=1 Tax=Salix koriyanagi TaxID=2511006 RepID=A0A9Q1AM42_9ROSI|nr:HOMEOBOX-LEUCINE ZIPPER PROTEIN MERISTEM L1 [Salix koriyanagi]
MSESEEINQVQEISSDEEMMRPDITDVISISSTDDSYITGSDDTESDDTENMESSDEGLEEILKSAPGEELGLLLDQEINPQEDNMIQNNGYVPFNSNNYQSPQLSPRSDQVESVSSTNMPFEINDRASDLLMAVSVGSDANKTKIIEMAVSAMEELVRKALAGEPLWQHRKDCDHEILNEGEYIREFRPFDASLGELMRIIQMEDPQNFPNLYDNIASPNGTQQHKPMFQQDAENNLLQTESSRHIGFVRMDATRLVECLMDLVGSSGHQYFSDIVSRATVLGVILGGVAGNYNETLQVMKAEFHMPTPLVNIRESQFARYCKQIEPGTWGVVDVSLDSLFPYPLVSFRRRPSGCLIMEIPGGYSKVIWVEHVEVDNKFVHRMFWPIVLPATIPRNGKTSVLRLARRMMRRFYQDSSASTDNLWVRIPLYDGEDFRLMTKTIYDLNGCPSSTLVFSKSLWVPAPPNRVFDLLRRGESRNKWDLLALGSLGYAVHENMHIIKGESPESRVSIMQVMNSAPNQIEILYLQESYRHPTGSYVVYAPIDILTMGMMLGGGNPDLVSIFPSGFVIHPDGPVKNGEETRGKSSHHFLSHYGWFIFGELYSC